MEQFISGHPEDGDFYCPECGSFNVEEIAYEDDFGSMECHQCKYQGDPGEDFPAYLESKDKDSKLTAVCHYQVIRRAR